MSMYQTAQEMGARMLTLDPALCVEGWCYVADQGGSFYRDRDHLSSHGSMYLKTLFSLFLRLLCLITKLKMPLNPDMAFLGFPGGPVSAGPAPMGPGPGSRVIIRFLSLKSVVLVLDTAYLLFLAFILLSNWLNQLLRLRAGENRHCQ